MTKRENCDRSTVRRARNYFCGCSINFVDVQLKNGETVKVDIDKLGEFWATNADTIETTYSASRRPRRR